MQTFEPMVSEIMDKAIRIVENGAEKTVFIVNGCSTAEDTTLMVHPNCGG
jgi:hydroxylamine reductase (hybrid-cluster protein)